MAKTFFPNDKQTLYVDASNPHPKNTQYKISIGLEQWDDTNHEVVKIQMVYNGKISGRRSPSFPTGTDDFQRVMKKVNELTLNRNL
jgi:hypothetical protein